MNNKVYDTRKERNWKWTKTIHREHKVVENMLQCYKFNTTANNVN